MEVYFVAYTCGKQGAFVGIDNEVNRYAYVMRSEVFRMLLSAVRSPYRLEVIA